MFYRGRLYLDDWSSWAASIQRLGAIADEFPVAHLINNHIEMTSTPGVAYPYGTAFQPEERVLELTREHLIELHEALQAMPVPVDEVHDDFIITPVG